MELDWATELFYHELSDEAAAYIAEFLTQLALCFENTHLSQIQRHYRDVRPQPAYDPYQLDLFTGNDLSESRAAQPTPPTNTKFKPLE
jgi:hypothetical protein